MLVLSSSLSQVLSFLSQEGPGGCPSSGLAACHGQTLFHLPDDPLSVHIFHLTTALVSASILSPGYCTGLPGFPILPGPPSPAALPCIEGIWYTLAD